MNQKEIDEVKKTIAVLKQELQEFIISEKKSENIDYKCIQEKQAEIYCLEASISGVATREEIFYIISKLKEKKGTREIDFTPLENDEKLKKIIERLAGTNLARVNNDKGRVKKFLMSEFKQEKRNYVALYLWACARMQDAIRRDVFRHAQTTATLIMPLVINLYKDKDYYNKK